MFHSSSPRQSWKGLVVTLLCSSLALASTAHAAKGVGSANRPPVISGTPATTSTVGIPYNFQPSASDPEGKAVSFKIRGKPAWATFNSATGLLSGTPALATTYSNIQVGASDGKNTTWLATFQIDVKEPASTNRAPTITGTPGTSVTSGTSYSFRPVATDADGDKLTFSITGQPAWASFDISSGTLSGTPSAAQVGTASGITISVTDGKASASLAPFSVTVVAGNHTPTISGAAVTNAQVDQPYAFRPTATDADGDTLSFGITGKPAWATFDATDGTLYGTPTAGAEGSYANVTIKVSDGKASATLAPFTITVNAAPTRSATLSWTAPTQNTDGTALTDLSGYKVFYGTTSRGYTESVTVSGAGATTAVIEGLPAGTVYFAVKSVNTVGVESDYTSEVTAVL